MPSEVTGIVLQYGLAGVIILALSAVVIYQNKEGKAKDQKIEELQEKRVQEAQQLSEKISGPINEQKELSQRIYDILLNRRDGGNG